MTWKLKTRLVWRKLEWMRNSDTLSVDAGTDFSAAEESTEASGSAEPISTDEVSTEGDFGMTETLPLPEETASADEHDGQDTIPAGNSTEPAEETGNPSEASSVRRSRIQAR